MSRPNLLILMPDQMRGDCVSSAGHPDARTPHLDRLAEGPAKALDAEADEVASRLWQ